MQGFHQEEQSLECITYKLYLLPSPWAVMEQVVCVGNMYIQLGLDWYFFLSSTYPGDKLLFKTPLSWWNGLGWRQPLCGWSGAAVELIVGGGGHKLPTVQVCIKWSTFLWTQLASLSLHGSSKQACLPER